MKKSYIILSLMLILLSFISCKEKQEKKETAAYKTMVIATSNQTLKQEYSARLTGKQIVEIRPQVTGNITRILINEGDAVKRGQALFVIDQVPYRAALQVAIANVKSAEAKLATAQMNYQSEVALKESQVVSDFSVQTSQNALQEAKAALALAKAQEVNARNNLSYTVVKSPVNGSASMIPWHVGSLVSSSISEPLVTVSDDHDMYAYFSITEKQVISLIDRYGSMDAFIRQTPAVRLKLATGTDYDLPGKINAVSGTVDNQTGAVTLRASFPNPKRLLHNGGTATVVLPTALSNCILVPQEATYELQDRVFVYKVVDGKTKATPVEVFRLNNGKEYVIEKGLTVGDTIIAEGAGLLREGIEIKHQAK
ncbi:MAG: efflux RND transporter periplasmic adaptor subunit [Prevotella sp.]|nr:efflux RND transporter periplasmic adaptor subunit [Prevotella sp.]MBQ9223161.1 efflux RND transporter periplasmic adaptor subunit [Prevotella sp.]